MKRSEKKLYRNIITALLIITVSAGGSVAQDNIKSPVKVSYKQFLDNIEQQLPELRKNRIQLEKARNTLYGAGSAEDINLSAESGYSKTDVFTRGSASEKKDYSAKIGLTKKITETGTEISTGAGYNRTEYETEGSAAYHYPSLYVKFNQSLLKNTFGIVDRYAVNNAKMQYEIQKLREIETNKSEINYYKKLYFTWIEYREELELINSYITGAKKIEDTVKSRFKSGMVNSADLYSASAIVLKYQIVYEELKTDMNTLQAELNIFFKEKTIEPDHDEFSALYTASITSKYPTVPFDRTGNAGIFRLTKSNLKYTADVSENKLLPQLDLVGEYTKKSADVSFSKSAENLNSTDYYLGFSFTHPLQNTENRSILEDAKLAIDEINSEYSISDNSYRKSLDSIISRRKDTERIINLREKRIDILTGKYRFELLKYQQGQLDLQTVIDTAIDVTNERISVIQLKKQIIDNYIDYMDLTEVQ